MKRRTFLQCCSAQACLAGHALLPAGMAMAATESLRPDLLVYDERFAHAAAHARCLADTCAASAAVPTRGDATPFRRLLPALAPEGGALWLAGVTPEPFHFCLQRLLQDQGPVESTIIRLDHDLCVWHLHCNIPGRVS